MNRTQRIRLHMRGAFLCLALSFAGSAWASTGACLNPSGQTVSGCSAVDGTFSGFIIPGNNEFSSAATGTNYLYNPSGTDWTFSSNGNTGGPNSNGALTYGSEWYYTAPPAGTQVAGLQQFSGSTSGASISQDISGFTVGIDYAVTFDIDERNALCNCVTGGVAGSPADGDAIEVLLGGQVLGTFTPTTDTWNQVTTGMTVATSTTMNLEFYSASLGTLSTSEVDSLFTDVTIEDPTPEPATLALVGGGLLLIAAVVRRRRRFGVSDAADASAT